VSAAKAPENPQNLVVAGKISTVHGVKGWLKIHSFTDPESNLFDYQPWWIKAASGWQRLEVDQFRTVTKGFIAHFRGLDDREDARLYCQREIYVSAEVFPPAEEGAVYWHQLQGLRVVSTFAGGEQLLGEVEGLLETGANDVLVVRPVAGSVDHRERLIPYIDQCVLEVDLDARRMIVDWDPGFETRND